VVVNIDRMKFSQVLRNLVSNALKFTPKRGKVTVTSSIVSPFSKDDESVIFADNLWVSNTPPFADFASQSTSSSSAQSSLSTSSPASSSSSSSSLSVLGRRLHSDLEDEKASRSEYQHYHGKKFVRISVTDTGSGINKEDQKHLFHEFTQFKADKLQNGQGSGLGLWSKLIFSLLASFVYLLNSFCDLVFLNSRGQHHATTRR
jgi:signal transduction histidine kinase